MRLLSILLVLMPQAALAQAATPAPSPVASFLPLILMVGVFYFLLIRPQQKRLKAHDAMVKSIKRGDNVVTAGGIIGRVTKADAEDVIFVEIAEGVEVKVARSTLTTLLDKDGKPVNVSAKPEKQGRNDNVKASNKNVANDN